MNPALDAPFLPLPRFSEAEDPAPAPKPGYTMSQKYDTPLEMLVEELFTQLEGRDAKITALEAEIVSLKAEIEGLKKPTGMLAGPARTIWHDLLSNHVRTGQNLRLEDLEWPAKFDNSNFGCIALDARKDPTVPHLSASAHPPAAPVQHIMTQAQCQQIREQNAKPSLFSHLTRSNHDDDN